MERIQIVLEDTLVVDGQPDGEGGNFLDSLITNLSLAIPLPGWWQLAKA